MSELRECPFGSDNIEPADRGQTVFCGGTYYDEEAEMEMEYCYSVPIEVFNHRPAESALRKRVGELCKLVKSAYIEGYQEGSQDYFGDQPEARYRAESIWLSSKWRKAIAPQEPTPPETEERI
jgi:hypothetical protein